MLGISRRALTGMAFVAAVTGLSSLAQAQFFPRYNQQFNPGYNPCNPCAQAAIAAPLAAAPTYQTAAVTDCPCLKTVPQTVYQDVQQIDYKPVKKTVKRPKLITVMEERDVVNYQRVTEARTVNVPSFTTQSYTECRPVTQNRSYWRTAWQPQQKYSPCQYDQRPGLLGEMNRLGLAFRNSFTPNYVARREFIPNVVAYDVPVQRTVQIPTTRQVTYNVARLVPVTTKQQVAVQKTIWEDTEVTAMEPVITRKRVAVGTQYRTVYVNPDGSTTADIPTPAKTAEGDDGNAKSADKGSIRLNSIPRSQPAPIQLPTYRQDAPLTAPEPTPASGGPVARSQTPSIIRVAGWRPTRPEHSAAHPLAGPELSVAQK